jgi:AAA domain
MMPREELEAIEKWGLDADNTDDIGDVVDMSGASVAMKPPRVTYDRLEDLEYMEPPPGYYYTPVGTLRPEPPEDEPRVDELPEPILILRSIRELREHVASQGPRQWLARGVWPAGAYGMLGGEPKAQKTWHAEDLAVSVASQTRWLDYFEVDHCGPVVIFCGEGGEGAILRRLDAIAHFKDEDLDILPITVCARAPHLNKIDHMAEFRAAVELHRPVLVILDPLYLAARGANLRDLYDMGAMLETPQRICTDHGAALMVVHHYNRSRDAKGAGRFSGAGPAEWGRVLVGTNVISRYTDNITKETRVITELEIIGGEVHDQRYRVTRRVRAEDPDDLDSNLHYHVTVSEGESMEKSTLSSTSSGLSPAAQRVYDVLAADPTGALSVREIGDRLADQGQPLKARTIQDALAKLDELDKAQGLVIDNRGKAVWSAIV